MEIDIKKATYKNYEFSRNKVYTMRLNTLNLPKNESLSMIQKYYFDEESTKKMLREAELRSEEYHMLKEQKEYEEMNYSAICRRLSNLSTLELLRRLHNIILSKIR